MGEERASDVVVIGAGPNGLAAACYLQRSGLNVMVLEQRGDGVVGGGATSEEVTLPGFRHNMGAVWMGGTLWTGVHKQLELKKYGVNYLYSDIAMSAVFEDGTCLHWYHDIDRMCANIARYNRKDAETWRDLFMTYKDTAPMWAAAEEAVSGAGSPSPGALFLSPLERSPAGRELIRLSMKPPSDLVNDFFEEPRLRNLLRQRISEGFTRPDDEPQLGNPFIMHLIMSHTVGRSFGLAEGGTGRVCEAIKKNLDDAGGRTEFGKRVEEIHTQGNAATGVTCSDGSRYTAKKAVISDVTHFTTLLKMVGEEKLEPRFARKVKTWKWEEHSFHNTHWALDAPPLWKASDNDADIQRCWSVAVLPLDADEHWRQCHEDNRAGRPPRSLGYYGSFPTLLDPSQAPSGKHTGLAWKHSPYQLTDGGAARWDAVKEEYAVRIEEFTARFTKNDFRKSILKRFVDSPLDIERRNPSFVRGSCCNGSTEPHQVGYYRPFHDCPQGRSPIERLYLVGDWVGVTGGAGRHAAGLILDDLKMKKWWAR
ncbi:MAG: phytoene desaturase family protein [Candidatus Binatia bacterium]